MKKKLLSCCLCMALLATACACSADTSVTPDHTEESAVNSSETDTATGNAGTEDTSDKDDDQISGMPNPIVAVNDTSEFETQLGITIMPDLMDDDYQLSIIGDSVAQVEFDKEGVDGDPIVCTLRATKDAEAAETLSGLYDNMEEENTTFTLDDGRELSVLVQIPETLPCKAYEFSIGNISYSFVYSGQMSQMLFAEVFDSVLAAIGANGTDTE